MEYSKADLEKHMREEHQASPFATYLKEIVYGGNDGIVTTFAVVAGFAGAQNAQHVAAYSFLTVLLFGIANLFADGASMGLGNFLSLRSEQDLYKQQKAKEEYEILNNPEMEKAETKELLMQKGFTSAQAEQLVEIYASNPTYWVQFMMDYELQLPNPEGENPFFTGLATFAAFLIFGFIPLIPFIFVDNLSQAFIYSCGFTAFALILLGLLRWKITKESIMRSVGEIFAIGTVSASIAYIVGIFFRA